MKHYYTAHGDTASRISLVRETPQVLEVLRYDGKFRPIHDQSAIERWNHLLYKELESRSIHIENLVKERDYLGSLIEK